MCSPLALAGVGLALSAAQAVGSYAQQSAAAKAANAQAAQQRRLAADNARRQYADISARKSQEQEAAANEAFNIQRKVRRTQSTQRAALSNAGVAGLSAEALLRDVSFQGGLDTTLVQSQLGWNLDQLSRSAQGVRANAMGQASVPDVAGPSPFGLVGSLVGTALNGYLQYRDLTRGPT